MLLGMRVLGRVLLGTLAIMFAMAFLARLVSRPRRRGRHVHATVPPRAVQAAAQPSHHHARSATCLAGLPGGSGWGRLVVPPSSRSRILRRNGRRAMRVMTGYRLQRRRFFTSPVPRLQKSVGAMTYGMRESSAPQQHAANEGFVRDGGLPRRLRAGASRRARRAGPGRDFAVAAAAAASSARRQALAARRA
jgi:hypothetical protein